MKSWSSLMRLAARRAVRYAGTLGWLDGRRGYPSEEQYIEVPVYQALPLTNEGHEESAAAVLQLEPVQALKERKE